MPSAPIEMARIAATPSKNDGQLIMACAPQNQFYPTANDRTGNRVIVVSAGTIMALMLLGALAACAPQVPLDQAEAACARQLLHWGTRNFPPASGARPG